MKSIIYCLDNRILSEGYIFINENLKKTNSITLKSRKDFVKFSITKKNKIYSAELVDKSELFKFNLIKPSESVSGFHGEPYNTIRSDTFIIVLYGHASKIVFNGKDVNFY